MIYLDNSATTRVRDEVREAMLPYLGPSLGNPSSLHAPGRSSHEAVAGAREQVAGLLNCKASEIYFTPCATYSNNVAILGRARLIEAESGPRHLITSVIEHPSCLGPAKFLEASGWDVTYLPVDRNGMIAVGDLQTAIKPSTAIISLMWANNEIGSVFPVREMAELARSRDIFFHTDAVQVPGKLALDMQSVQADSLALSGHKFYAPKGIGILYLREGVKVEPIFFGGGQEAGLFPGTEPVANIVGIGRAAELAAAELDSVQPQLRAMQEFLMSEFLSIEGARVSGPSAIEQRLPGHVSFVVAGLEGEAAVLQSDLKGLCISSASACHKGTMQPSHVVSALGISDELALGSLRVSTGRFSTMDECKQAAEVIKKVVAASRKKKLAVS